MTDKPEPQERRRFPRLKQACAIRYKTIDGEGFSPPDLEAHTVNISGGGISFASAEPVEPGKLLAIELTLPDFESAVISLGRVVWCEPHADGGHEVGMEFWWVGWDDQGAQQAISDHIRRALEK
jgi:hypothetical protein